MSALTGDALADSTFFSLTDPRAAALTGDDGAEGVFLSFTPLSMSALTGEEAVGEPCAGSGGGPSGDGGG